MVRIATWNINSVRLRMPLLKKLVAEAGPDIICLQETKVDDPLFPHADIRALGFEHIYFSGQKSYNGVAILSRIPLSGIHSLKVAGSDHKRHISALLPDGTELHNFYVPAGGDIPDRDQNPAFGFKLDFVDWMTQWFAKERASSRPMVLVGDLNIAPLPADVWSHKQLLKVVSHTPVETGLLAALQNNLSWVDSARHFTPAEEKLYTWWSYRNRDWRASDRGRRLDHIWVTPPLKSALRKVETLKDCRSWEQASDHVPVVTELELAA
jgi:exodeoxyribonuclease-3